MHKLSKILFSRVIINGILILLQALFAFSLFFYLSELFTVIYFLLMILGFFIAMALLNDSLNPSFKMPWLLLLVVFPILGVFLYLLNGKLWIRKKYRNEVFEAANYEYQDEKELEEIKEQDKQIYRQAKYIYDGVNSPIYKNTEATYYKVGEDMFKDMIKDLKNAKRFIFLEYFIIEKGKMWDTILNILLDKKDEGVDVRIMYDDIGCISKLPNNYYKELEKMGIPCVSFNRFKPVLSIIYNNRDHRKIMVIDGNIGYTGGINLADEYINETSRFGHWKDTGIRLKGEAVSTLTMIFLDSWNIFKKENSSFEKFLAEKKNYNSDGYFAPYGDSPLKKETAGETVYLNMINAATDYVYITTPYLILTYELVLALTNAAKRGVDVKIITPSIPDKWIVHAITESYYPVLMRSGVEIYEYSPGFIHSKTFICDDKVGVVGTINLDFRSLYHHYENGVWIYQSKVLKDIKEDFRTTLGKCNYMDEARMRAIPWYKKLIGTFAKIFAPLM